LSLVATFIEPTF